MARPAIRAGDMEVEPPACPTGGVALDEWHVALEAVVQNQSGERLGLVDCRRKRTPDRGTFPTFRRGYSNVSRCQNPTLGNGVFLPS